MCKKITLPCVNCGELVTRYKTAVPKSGNILCSLHCRKEFQSGANNPNYGNKWNDTQRALGSEISKKRFEDMEMRYAAGKANRGKKFSEDRIQAMHSHRTPESYTRTHSLETKEKIGRASKAKFTEEFKLSFRKKMESTGHWVSMSDKNDKQIYFIKASWEKCLNRYVENIELFYADPFKMVRDHVYGRHVGYEEGVFPEILRHPCNCRIITRNENASKRHKKDTQDKGHTKEELFSLIEGYTGGYPNQDLCLELINKYKNGERWERLSDNPIEEDRL